ncbi:hypothetical protein N7504_000708 [Penicillium tannophilum]|nr:hypothetical protein N7504_000708 [Penicillium tannophilum]
MTNIVRKSRIVLKKQRSSLDEGHKMPQQQVHSYVNQRSLRSQYRVGFGIAEDSREAGSHQERLFCRGSFLVTDE